jgi:hypothetical protein
MKDLLISHIQDLTINTNMYLPENWTSMLYFQVMLDLVNLISFLKMGIST